MVAGISVCLVALPLALGIAIASDLPPISGVISAIVGGVVTTFIRGSHVAINGPANGLIVVLLAAVEALRDGNGVAHPYVLAAVILAGAFQVVMGLGRLGTLGDFFPTSVIQGMLAGFGVIIVAKQVHVAIGSHATGSVAEVFTTLPQSLFNLNLPVFLIAAGSLAILIVHSQIKNRTIHFLPAPLWVLLFAVPLAYLFDFGTRHQMMLAGQAYWVGPEFLIRIPASLAEAMVMPDFSRVGEPVFMMVVFTLCFVTSVETVLSAKAVDKLDPYRRRTDLNRDLAAVGVSTMVSGVLGGLPVTAVIVRSSVNVNHGAQTRWSNFFHGLLLLLAILLIPETIQKVPLAALAAILIFTGYRLAGPKVFRDALRKGNEQFVLLLFTLCSVLVLGLMEGIAAGLAFTLLLHWIWSNLEPLEYLRCLVRPDLTRTREQDGVTWIKVRGVASFVNLPWLDRMLGSLPDDEAVVIDLAHAKLVDTTTQEYLHEREVRAHEVGRRFETVGLSHHMASSDYPFSLRRIHSPLKEARRVRLSPRQRRLSQMAQAHGWAFDPGIDWEPLTERVFHFFESRPIEYRRNVIRGRYEDLDIEWEVEDLTFDEGAFLATEEHHTTVHYLRLPFELPLFSVERREFLDRLLEMAGYQESDFVVYPAVSSEFVVRGLPGADLAPLFSEELLGLLHREPLYHLESNGTALLLFRYDRLAGPQEVEAMIEFSHELVEQLRPR